MVLSPRRALRALKGLKYSALLLCFIVILLPTPTMGTADPTPNDASTQPSWLNQLPFQFAAPVFQIVPWIINALQVQYRNMEQVAVLAEMQLANLTEPSMEDYRRKKRFVSPILWDLIQSRFNRMPVAPELLLPRERRELRNVSQEMAAQINRTAGIIQALLNPGFGLPKLSAQSNFTEINQILHEVETDLHLALEALPRNVSRALLDSARRSQSLSTFAVFSLIIAVIMAIILVAGICAQMIIMEEPEKKTPLPIIKMTSIIDPEDLDSDALNLIQVDPRNPVVVGETP